MMPTCCVLVAVIKVALRKFTALFHAVTGTLFTSVTWWHPLSSSLCVCHLCSARTVGTTVEWALSTNVQNEPHSRRQVRREEHTSGPPQATKITATKCTQNGALQEQQEQQQQLRKCAQTNAQFVHDWCSVTH